MKSMRAMIKSFITTIKRRLGLIPKDFSIGGYDYNRMMASNSARNDENTSVWSPGALKRLEKKQRKDRRAIDKKSMVYLAEQRMKDKRR